MDPFVLNQEYPRTRLLEFLGSRQGQSGILWGSREPGCLICTSGGRHGKAASYSDEHRDDGSWWYIGQGTTGDQTLKNAANAKMASGEKSILLFSTREPTANEVKSQGGYGKLFRYRGSFNVVDCEEFRPAEGSRKGDKLLRFLLVPAEVGESQPLLSALGTPGTSDLAAMQAQLTGKGSTLGTGQLGIREYRKRSAKVHQYALLRAAGICEGCHEPGPFVDSAENRFLEVHHILRLADDGPDEPGNVASVCPNCHKRAHFSKDKAEFGKLLLEHVSMAEAAIRRS